ncbi:MAG: pyruvate kinase [Eubacteriales bacterium]
MNKIMKKTKIICTIGPACESEEILGEMIKAGMNVARLNFSHGSYEEHKIKLDTLNRLRIKTGEHIGILLDTKGPEIRTGKFSSPEVFLEEGQSFYFTPKEIIGDKNGCTISYKMLWKDIVAGNKILVDDGIIELIVTSLQGEDIICKVLNSGTVKDNKGINVPGIKTKLPAINEKDYEDIIFGIKNNIDFIALSFVRTVADVEVVREILRENKGSHIRIIAKIENREGIENIDDILIAADGIMVARGDLGVEIPQEEVPLMQKKIIKKCNFAGKPVITATQMLDSMTRNPRPTRAEVADVSNAIFDGTDAIMLSGETAIGKYPVETVVKMSEIAMATENDINYESLFTEKVVIKDSSTTDAIGYATCSCANGLKATAIITPTTSGYTPMVVSKFRPKAPIMASMTSEIVARRLSLVFGVNAYVIPDHEKRKQQIEALLDICMGNETIKQGDTVIITAGVPKGEGNTNMMQVHIVGKSI